MTDTGGRPAFVPSQIQKKFFEYVRPIWEQRGLTYRELAAACGIQPQAFGNIARSQSELSLERAVLICDLLGIPVDEFRKRES